MQIKHTTRGQYLQQKKAVQTCKLSKQKRIFHTMLVKNWLKQWLKWSKASKKKKLIQVNIYQKNCALFEISVKRAFTQTSCKNFYDIAKP